MVTSVYRRKWFLPLMLIVALLLAYIPRWHVEAQITRVSDSGYPSVYRYVKDRWTGELRYENWRYVEVKKYVMAPGVIDPDLVTGVWAYALVGCGIWLLVAWRKERRRGTTSSDVAQAKEV